MYAKPLRRQAAPAKIQLKLAEGPANLHSSPRAPLGFWEEHVMVAKVDRVWPYLTGVVSTAVWYFACPENGSPPQWTKQAWTVLGPSAMKTLFSKRRRIGFEAWKFTYKYADIMYICAPRMCIHVYCILHAWAQWICMHNYCICTHVVHRTTSKIELL